MPVQHGARSSSGGGDLLLLGQNHRVSTLLLFAFLLATRGQHAPQR